MLFYGINLFRKSLNLSGAYFIAKFIDKKDNWSTIKQDQYRNYFQMHSVSIIDKVYSIITNLGNSSTNFERISQSIEQFNYSNHLKSNFQEPQSYIYLLVAMQMRGAINLPQFRNLKEKMIQLLYRSNWQNCVIDNKALLITIKSIEDLLRVQKQNKKHQAAKNIIFQLLYHNFNCVTFKQVKYVVQILNQETYATKINQRSQKIADLIFARIHQLILNILGEDLIADQHKFMFQPQLIIKIANLYNFFKTNKSQYIQSFYRFSTQRLIPHFRNNQQNVTMLCNEIYRSIPNNIANNQSQNYKKLMLQWIINLYKSSQSLMYVARGTKEAHHLCYTIITHYYDTSFQQLPFETYNGFTELKPILLKPPTLPSIFWEFYELNYRNLNKYPVIYHAIKNSYPQHLKIDHNQKPLQLLYPFVQTEMNVRTYQALKKLKIKFIPEIFLQGRFIDYYLPQENIILQIDGLRHFSRRQLKYSDSTHFRNLHLLLSGYKLIVVNIFEYNIAREVQDLSQLIQIKLDRIRQGAICVF